MMLYDLLKSGHIVAVILWFGGMMSTALLLTYGSGGMTAGFQAWDRSVTTPAMIVTWALGLTMAIWSDWFTSGWMNVKLVFVLALSVIHGILSGRLRRAAAADNFGEAPVIRLALPAMMICLGAIVLLVVTKAF
ncbi:CopD family protein [Phyllobacterium phragmitis]